MLFIVYYDAPSKALAENASRITANKYISAYMSGLGFGIISGTFLRG